MKKDNGKQDAKQVKASVFSKIFSNYRLIGGISIVLFIIGAVLFLGEEPNYLRKIESLSLFQSTSQFFSQCMSAPGGFLVWLATFLTQSFYTVWVGILVYVALMLLCAFAISQAFNLRKSLFPLAFVMPCMAMLALMDFGYTIFSIKTPGFAFLFPLGILFVSLLFWGYRALSPWWARLVAIVLMACVGYWLAGAYGLFAVALSSIWELASALGKKMARPFISIAIAALGIVCFIAIPKLWMPLIGGDLIEARTYLYALPRYNPAEGSLWLPYQIVAVMLLLFAILDGWNVKKSQAWLSALSVCVFVGVWVAVFSLRFNDANFKLTINLDRAMQDNDWQKAADLAREFDGVPTRFNVALTDIALFKLGKSGSDVFTYQIGAAPYETTRALRVIHDGGALPITYFLGLNNYAYRWGMESKVEYGTNVENLKYMAKCALLNGEYALAEKYLDNLSLTANHKGWAEKYRKYAKNPELIDEDEELAAIKPLIHSSNFFVNDGGALESYFWPMLSNRVPENAQQLELSMMAALICKNIDGFERLFSEYVKTAETIPPTYQEAILLWTWMYNNRKYAFLQPDKAILDRFQQFIKMGERYATAAEGVAAELMRPSFGDTYWYYYGYTENLKIV